MAVSSEGELEKSALLPYDKLFVKPNIGTVKVGTVTGIEKNAGGAGGDIVLADGEKVHYDVLVLTPGSKWTGVSAHPTDKTEALEFVNAWRKRFQDAKSVVIVGGGAVGIELAGEIKDVYPETKVTIVHGEKQLINKTYPDKFRKEVEKKMKARGVELVLEEFANDFAEGATEVTTSSGKTLQADVIVSARGPRPNTEFIGTSLGAETLTDRGHVKVRPTLQLASYPDMFCAGDVLDWDEQSQAAKSTGHVSIVVGNVISVLEGKPTKEVYKGSTEMIVLTNGKKGGAIFVDMLWGLMLGDTMASMAKSKGLLLPMVRKNMGLA